MKALILYYSRGGITKKAAVALSNALKCDIEEIVDNKNRKGILGWLYAGRDATLGNVTKIKDITKEVTSYDLIMIGGPVWAGNVSPAVRTLLLQSMEQIKNAAFFCTTGGSDGKKAFRVMEEILGKKPLATLALKWGDIKSGNYLAKAGKFIDAIRSART